MLRGTPASFFVMAAGVPLGVLLAWAELRLPALVVSEVTGGQTFLHAALAVGALLVLTFLAVGLRDFCKTILEAQESRYRFYLTSCLEEKSMAMFYQTYEKKQTRDMRKRAEEASYMMNGKVPLCQVPNLMTELIRNALCYALFGTILSRISPLLLVLLTLAALVNLLCVRAYNRYEYASRGERTDIGRRLRYVSKNAADFAAAKDIRIYGMATWLRETFSDLFRQDTAWSARLNRRLLLGRLVDLLVILLRDGGAYALLLVASDDSDRIARRFEQEFPPLEKIKDIYERVCSYLQIGIGDGGEASFLFNIHDFCARERLYSGTVASALKLLQQNGYMTLTDAQENPARVMFCVSRDELYKLRVQRDELDHFIRTLLRLYNGVFTEFRPIDEGELATWSGYTVQRVKELLKRLWQLRVIRYIPSNRSPILFMNEERLPRADLYIAPETYKRRQELMRERFEQMIAYAANEQECRSAVLERYFGEEDPAPCGVCDVCLARKRAAKAAAREAGTASGTPNPGAAGDAPGPESALREKLLERLARSPADPRQLAAELACPPERLAEAVRELLGEGAVRTFADGRLGLFSAPDSPEKAK